MPETLADDLRRVRVLLGLTQEQVAERAGLSLASVKSFEAGKQPNQASLDALRAALLLGIKPAPAPVPGVPRNPISSEWEFQSEVRVGELRIVISKAKRSEVG